jgi:hypothetical protein
LNRLTEQGITATSQEEDVPTGVQSHDGRKYNTPSFFVRMANGTLSTDATMMLMMMTNDVSTMRVVSRIGTALSKKKQRPPLA